MKRFALLALLAAMAATTVNSQAKERGWDHEPGGLNGTRSAERQVERLGELLGLSPEQAGQVLTVLKQAEIERQALYDQIHEQLEPEICALHLYLRDQFQSILTAEQWATLEALKADRTAQRATQGGNGHRKSKSPPDCSAYES